MRSVTTPRPDPLILTAERDLDASQTSVLRRQGAQGGIIRVALVDLAPARKVRSEMRLNVSARDCGCETGSRAAAFVLLVALVVDFARTGSAVPHGLAEIVAMSLFVLGAALVGKAVGIIRARRRLAAELRSLREYAGAV